MQLLNNDHIIGIEKMQLNSGKKKVKEKEYS